MIPHSLYIYGNLDFLGKSAAAKRMHYYAKALADQNNEVYLVSCCSNKFVKEDFIEIEPNVFILAKKKLTYNLISSFGFLRYLSKFSKNKEGSKTFILYPQSWFNLELLTVFYFIFFKKYDIYYEFNEVKKYSPAFHERQSFKRIKYAIKTVVSKTKFIVMDYLMYFYKGLICISNDSEIYGKKYNTNTIRIPILTNPEITLTPSLKTYQKKEYFNIGFSGSIIPSKENLFEFIGVIEQIHKDGYKVAFNLCGSVLPKNLHSLHSITRKRKDIITYYGDLDEKELSNFLLQQDLLVLPRGFTLQNKYGFSTKLSDYLNHKKVILVTNISDNALYIEDGFNGFVVEPDDSKMMYERLIYIIENFETIKEPIIENAFKTSKEKFDYRLYSEVLTAFLKESQGTRKNETNQQSE